METVFFILNNILMNEDTRLEKLQISFYAYTHITNSSFKLKKVFTPKVLSIYSLRANFVIYDICHVPHDNYHVLIIDKKIV